MSEQKWIPFDLDVNFFFGTIETFEKWNKLVRNYREKTNGTAEDITRARKNDRKEDRPAGFSFKGTGPTLAEWAKENGVDLRV